MDHIEDCVQEAVGDSCQARPASVCVVGLEKWTAYKRGRIRKALRKLVSVHPGKGTMVKHRETVDRQVQENSRGAR